MLSFEYTTAEVRKSTQGFLSCRCSELVDQALLNTTCLDITSNSKDCSQSCTLCRYSANSYISTLHIADSSQTIE